MIFHHYYRSSSSKLLAARQADLERSIAIERQGFVFAEEFQARPLFTRGFAPVFLGITFTKERPAPHNKLWQRAYDGPPVYTLRREEPPNPALKGRWHSLKRVWDACWPKGADASRTSALLTEVGVSEADLNGHSVHFFEHGGYAYFACTRTLENMTEIIATEFLQAQDDAVKEAPRD